MFMMGKSELLFQNIQTEEQKPTDDLSNSEMNAVVCVCVLSFHRTFIFFHSIYICINKERTARMNDCLYIVRVPALRTLSPFDYCFYLFLEETEAHESFG